MCSYADTVFKKTSYFGVSLNSTQEAAMAVRNIGFVPYSIQSKLIDFINIICPETYEVVSSTLSLI